MLPRTVMEAHDFIVNNGLRVEGDVLHPEVQGDTSPGYNWTVKSPMIPGMPAVEGSGPNLIRALDTYQERAKELAMRISEEASGRTTYLLKMAGCDLS